MNIKSCEKKEKSTADIVVEFGADELETALMEAYRKNRGKIAVPGFRKGKAPRKIIERMYGDSIFHSDVLDELVPKAVQAATEDSELRIVGYPQATDVDFKENNQGLDITITVGVYPEVEVGEYKGLSAVKYPAEAPETEIDSEVEAIRLRNARIEIADRPAANGDVAVIDYEGFLDGETFEGGTGENYELELGSGAFIPGFEEKLEGASAGEEREIDLVFPDNYTEELAGRPVVFKVKVNEVKEKILPDLDDEFAKDVSEFDTLDEYKADIRERLLAARQQDSDVSFENDLMDKLVGSIEMEIPETMILEQMEVGTNNFANQVSSRGIDPSTYLQMMGITPEKFQANMRKTAEKQVRIMLALEKIAELEGIEVSEEELEEEYKDGAQRYEMEVDKLKESVDKDTILRDIKIRKAAIIVTDNATALDHEEAADAPEGEPAESTEPAETEPAETPKPKKKSTKKKADPEAAEVVKE